MYIFQLKSQHLFIYMSLFFFFILSETQQGSEGSIY